MSKSRKHYIHFFFLLILVSATAFGQKTPEVLTNAKIIELVRMGLGESLIVAKINQSTCQCDTSTAALGKLKTAKVSDAIIMAMINAEYGEKGISETVINVSMRSPAKPAETRSSVETSAEAGPAALRQITEPGIYLFEDGKMTAIEPSVFSGTKANFLKGALTYGIMKTKFRAKVRQSSANMKVAGAQPVFYFVFNPEYKNSGATMAGTGLWWGMPATSPAEFLMVQMAVKQASREAIMGEYGAFSGMSTGARDKDIREYSFEKIKTGVYKVVPKTPLTPGEYCFFYAGTVTGLGFAGGKVFDFSIK
jgi:hypothetical protein